MRDAPRRERVRGVVVGVVAEAVREAGAEGVALTAPPGPERDLLLEWLGGGDAGRLHVPDEAAVGRVAECLAREGEETREEAGGGHRDEARLALARAAAAGGLLVASALTKTLLLLEGGDGSDLHPLGDVWASTVEAWTGSATRPALVSDPADLAALDRALRRWLEERRPLPATLLDVPAPLRPEMERLLRRPLRCGRPPIVPKLTHWTPGVDPPV